MGDNRASHRQLPPSNRSPSASWSSHHPVWSKHLRNVQVPYLLYRLSLDLRHYWILLDTDPYSEIIRMDRQFWFLAEHSGDFHLDGSNSTQPTQLQDLYLGIRWKYDIDEPHCMNVLTISGAIDPTTITPDANGVYPPVIHYGALPVGSLIGAINGLLSGVLAYAGIQLFVEFMAEMRRPHDFLKGMFIAQFVIYVCYVVYGCFMYYYQGQYTFNPSYLGVSQYGWQTAGTSLFVIYHSWRS